MKKLIAAGVIAAVLSTGCARTNESIGIVAEVTKDSPLDGVGPRYACTRYEIIWGNIFWGAVLFETIIAPIYFFGFSVLDPVGPIPGCTAK